MWLYDTVIIIKSIYSEQHFVQSVYSKRINAGTRTHDYNNWLYALQLAANIKTNRKQGLERGRWGEHSRSNILAVSKRYRGNSACWFCPIFHLSTLQCQHSVRRYVVSARCVVTSSALGVSYIIVSVWCVITMSLLGVSLVSALGASLQCWRLKYCFTSTETAGLLGTGAQDGHLDFHTAPELISMSTLGVSLLSALGASLQCQRSVCHYSVSARCVFTVSVLGASLECQRSVRHYSISPRCFIAESALGASL